MFASAPELAAQAYADAFDVEPSVAALHGWLLALARDDAPGGGRERVAEAARQGVGTLRRDNRIVTGEAQDRALDALGAAVGTEALVDAVTALVETL